MLQHKGYHIPTNAELSDVAAVDAVETVQAEDALLGVEDLLLALGVVDFEHCKLILVEKLLQVSLDEL